MNHLVINDLPKNVELDRTALRAVYGGRLITETTLVARPVTESTETDYVQHNLKQIGIALHSYHD